MPHNRGVNPADTASGGVPPIQPGALRDGDLCLELATFEPHRLHKVPTYHFRIVHADTGEELGTINLRVGSSAYIQCYAGHVGYAVHAQHRLHRYATRALRLLMPFARELGLDPLWITCDPTNQASRRTLELAGAEFVEVVDVPADTVIFQGGARRKCRYKLAVLV